MIAIKLIFPVLVFYSSSLLAQQNLVREDFAFGNEITVSEPKSVIEITLPEDVYMISKSPALSDLGVFNSRNELVPHWLVRSEIKAVETIVPPVDLSLFPVYETKGAGGSFENIKVATSMGGAIVEIQDGKTEKGYKSAIAGYLIDASKLETGINKIQFFLDSTKENHFIKMYVEGSEDLKNWRMVEPNGVLGRFEINNEQLVKDEIQLNGARYKYYRLAWRNAGDEVALRAVKAHFSSAYEVAQEPLQWKIVAGVKTENPNDQIIYQYDVGGYYPISGLKVSFADQNSTASVLVEATNDENGQWSLIRSVNFFSVTKEGATLANLETTFDEREFRFWRIRLNSSLAGVGSRFPEVSFGWQAKKLRFLARGEGPFTIAYGSAKASNVPQVDLINRDWTNDIATGMLNEKMAFGGSEKLVVVEKSEFPWKKIILWSLLLLGVVFLGAMALQVKKQMPPGN